MAVLLTLIAFGDSQGLSGAFERVVTQVIEQEEAAAVLHAGDIVDSETGWNAAVRQIRRMEDWGFPVITTRGNHDDSTGYLTFFPELPQEVDLAEEPFGVTVLSVDSNLGAEHLQFVVRKVEERPERRFIVLLHHPPETCVEESSEGFGSLWGRSLARVLRPTDLIVSGHLHVSCEFSLSNGTQVLVTARAGKKRYACLPQSELPEGATCDDDLNPEYIRIELMDDGSWEWTKVEVP